MNAITVTFDYTDSDSAREREFARVETQHGPGQWRRGAGSCAARAVWEFWPDNVLQLEEFKKFVHEHCSMGEQGLTAHGSSLCIRAEKALTSPWQPTNNECLDCQDSGLFGECELCKLATSFM